MPKPNLFHFIAISALLVLGSFAPTVAFADPDIDRIFEKFDQAENGAITEAKGTCIACEKAKTNTVKPTNNQIDLVKLRQSTQKVATCITCDRLRVIKKGKFEIIDPPPQKASSSASTSTSETWGQYPEIMNYSNSAKVQETINSAITESRYYLSYNGARTKKKQDVTQSTTWCYRHVKWALLRGGVVSSYPGGLYVNKPQGAAIKNLEGHGFKNLMTDPKYKDLIKNPASAPKGAVMIYSGGARGGHIEIKTDFGTAGTYVSDYQASKSVLQNELGGMASRSYKLIGVMVKPGV